MTTSGNRSGFTLVEVLVVIVVVSMLASLLIAAIYHMKRPPHGPNCMQKQRELAVALLSYENAKKQFPGYVNRIKTREQESFLRCSWTVGLLPYLGREDLWRLWREGQPVYVSIGLMNCPQDQPKQAFPSDTPLSYVVNCGRPGNEDTVAHGVFHNHDVDGRPVVVGQKVISEHDGATYTLLFSENVQAGRWADTTEASVGMVWREKPDKCSAINQCLDAGDRPQDIRYARPSSRHPGGVVATFCDGHQEFLSEGIDYQVYQHLMTPDSKAAGVPGVFDPNKL